MIVFFFRQAQGNKGCRLLNSTRFIAEGSKITNRRRGLSKQQEPLVTVLRFPGLFSLNYSMLSTISSTGQVLLLVSISAVSNLGSTTIRTNSFWEAITRFTSLSFFLQISAG